MATSTTSTNSHLVPLVAILDPNEQALASVARSLTATKSVQLAGTARRFDELSHLMSAEPDILLMDVTQNPVQVAATVQDILNEYPRCQIILMADQDEQIDLPRAMRAGARGLIRRPVAPDELLDTITEVFQTEMARMRRIEEQTKAKVTQGRAGEVITVFSPKGGVGCTMVATHLATALAGIEKSKVALVDFDLQFGDVAVHLDLRSNHGVHELMRSLDDLDGSILNDVMVVHQPSGIRVLLPPATLDQVDDVEPEGLATVVRAIRKYYDFVVIDTWHAIEEATLSLIDLSDELIVVTTPEVPSLRSARRFLDYIRERPDRRNKARIVVNRYPSKSAVSMKEIETSLGTTPIGTIPSDGRLITTAVNEGVTFLGRPGPASASIKQLAATLAQPRISRLRGANQQAQK